MPSSHYRFSARQTPLDATKEEDQMFQKIAFMNEGAEISVLCRPDRVNALRSRWLWWRRKRKHLMLCAGNYPEDVLDPGAYIAMRVDSVPGSDLKRFVFYRPENWSFTVEKEGKESTE